MHKHLANAGCRAGHYCNINVQVNCVLISLRKQMTTQVCPKATTKCGNGCSDNDSLDRICKESCCTRLPWMLNVTHLIISGTHAQALPLRMTLPYR